MKIDARAQKVFDHIDVDELVKVTLDLGNIDSPTGSEGPVGEYVYDWLRRQGFEAQQGRALCPTAPTCIGDAAGHRASARSLVLQQPHGHDHSQGRVVDDAARRRSRLPHRVA